MIKIFQKKPTITKALQYNGTNSGEVLTFCKEDASVDNITGELHLNIVNDNGDIETVVVPNRYFILKNKNNFKLMNEDLFKENYVEVFEM